MSFFNLLLLLIMVLRDWQTFDFFLLKRGKNMQISMKKFFRALYSFFKSGNLTSDVQGLVDNSQFKNISTGLRWTNPENLGFQIRTGFQEGRPNGFSFKIEKSLLFDKQMVKTVPYQRVNVVKPFNG